jgi:hypothetical protein
MKQVSLFIFISILFIPFFSKALYSAEYTILMRNGGSFEAASYGLEGENIKIILAEPRDAIIDIRRDDVEKIIKNKKEKTISVPKTSVGICETENINCNQYYCCHEIDLMKDETKSVCTFVEDPRNSLNVI